MINSSTLLCVIARTAAMDLSSLYYPDDFIIDLECQLIQLYHTVILNDINFDFNYLTPFYLKKVKDAFKKTALQNGNSSIYFDTPGYRSAYLFLYSPCFSSAVAYHFEKLLNIKDENFCLFQRVILKNSVNICCLGGGPCTEFVAIVKVFEAMINKYYPRTKYPLKICVTIIDIDPGWQYTFEKVWMSLSRFIDTSLVQFKMNFIKADLTEPLSENVQDALRRSDVVTMVKLLSAIQGTDSKDRILPMIQKVHQCMAKDGVLFVLDSGSSIVHERPGNILNSFDDMLNVYGPIHHTYNMSGPAKEVCFNLYFEHYGEQCCATETKNYVSAWQKCSSDNFQNDTPLPPTVDTPPPPSVGTPPPLTVGTPPPPAVEIFLNSSEEESEQQNTTSQEQEGVEENC